MRAQRSGLALLAISLCLPGCYLGHLAVGQGRLLAARRPVAEVLADPATAPGLGASLALVAEARDYAGAIGLEVGGQYTSYVELPGDRVLTTLVAAAPGSVEPAGFWFPFLGRVPYKGFFDPERAEAEAEDLRARGLDACVTGVPAYSTLGWMDDPVTGPMVRRGQGALAETLLHELVHATLYLKDAPDWNEGVASFVGEEGSVRLFAASGRDAEARRAEVEEGRRVDAELLRLRRAVADLYAARPAGAAREAARGALEREARERLAALPLSRMDPLLLADQARLNDACLALAGTYAAYTPHLVRALEGLGGDLAALVAGIRAAAQAGESPPASQAARPVGGGSPQSGPSGSARCRPKRGCVRDTSPAGLAPGVAVPRLTPELAAAHASRLRDNVERALRGRPEAVRRAIETLIAKGHLLLEDVPGVGKTTLAHAIARSIHARFRRIQFTSDLLPSDLLGTPVPEQRDGSPTGGFVFQPGPIFANVVLADEINRASPKTQSALLEAMGESAVTVDGVRHPLPSPFFVVATQNPLEQHGTHPLPESQLDRFLVRCGIGYPDAADEAAVLCEDPAATELPNLEPVVTTAELLGMQAVAERIKFDDSLVAYTLEIVRRTREHEALAIGVSPRGAIALRRAAQARALLDGRDYCIPDDIHDLAVDVLAHRITIDPRSGSRSDEETVWIVREILEQVAVPL